MEILFNEIKARKDLRSMVLLSTYFLQTLKNNDNPSFDSYEIDDYLRDSFKVESSDNEINRASEYLESEKLLEWVGNTGPFKLSHYGLKTVEEFIEKMYVATINDEEFRSQLDEVFGDIEVQRPYDSTQDNDVKKSVIANIISHLIVNVPQYLDRLKDLI